MQIVEMIAWLEGIWDADGAAAEGNGTIAWLTFREPDGSMRYTAVASGEPDDHWVIDGQERTDYASVNVVLDWHDIVARVAAERALLTEYRETIEYYNNGARNAPAGEVTGLETALKIIASGYSGRPGYQEEWRS